MNAAAYTDASQGLNDAMPSPVVATTAQVLDSRRTTEFHEHRRLLGLHHPILRTGGDAELLGLGAQGKVRQGRGGELDLEGP